MSTLQFLEQQRNSIFSLIFIFLSLLFFFFFKFRNSTKHNLPPSPLKLPIIGNLHQLGLFPHRTLQSLAQIHGSLMLLHFGSAPTLVVSSADAAREVMKTHDLIFSSRPNSNIAKQLFYNNTDLASAPYGEYWRQMRRICVLQLLSPKQVLSFRTVREEETSLLIEKIKNSSLKVLNLTEMLALLTNDVICRVAFGKKYNNKEEGGRRFKELLIEFGTLLGVFNVGDFIPSLAWVNYLNGLNNKVKRVFKELDAFLDEVIEDHIVRGVGGEDKQDFVEVLLGIEKEDSSIGISICRDNVKAIILDMFAAGTDTTYTSIEWAMAELLKNPKEMKKVQEEVRSIVEGKSTVTEQDLEQLHYLKSTIKETLRLHPPVALLVPRESIADTKIQGYDIPAKTRVIINAWAIGRDLRSWESPENFWPERFMSGEGREIDFKGQNFELIPFGAGRRGCPGIHFAVAINELVLANLLYKFDWALADGARLEDLDLSESFGVTIHKKSPLLVVATPHF